MTLPIGTTYFNNKGNVVPTGLVQRMFFILLPKYRPYGTIKKMYSSLRNYTISYLLLVQCQFEG